MRGLRLQRRPLVAVLALAVPLLCVAARAEAQGGQLVDRIAAIVNDEVITLSQLQRATRLAGSEFDLQSGLCMGGSSASQEPTEVLRCMIDALLMFQHVRRFPQFDVQPDDVDAAYQRIVDHFESREAFDAELARRQLTPAELRYDLLREALVVNYVDLRYGQVIDISEVEARRYYDEVLRPEMDRIGAEMPEFDAARPLIVRNLAAEQMNRRLTEWIADLRRRASIVLYVW